MALNVMQLEFAYYAARELSILSACPRGVQPSALRIFLHSDKKFIVPLQHYTWALVETVSLSPCIDFSEVALHVFTYYTPAFLHKNTTHFLVSEQGSLHGFSGHKHFLCNM